VERDNRGFTTGQDVPIGHPTSPALSLFSQDQTVLNEHLIDALEPGTVVPNDTVTLWKTREELSCGLKLFGIGTVQTDDYFVQIRDFLELFDDFTQGGSFELAIERGKDESHRSFVGQRNELFVEPFGVRPTETVESGDDTRLKEVTHVSSLHASRRSRLARK
jgi:hypothetical protein